MPSVRDYNVKRMREALRIGPVEEIMDKRMGYDAPRVTRDEATELCVYHLRMAAALFQLVPDDGNSALVAEINRQCSDDEFCIEPAKVWAESIFNKYEQAKERD